MIFYNVRFRLAFLLELFAYTIYLSFTSFSTSTHHWTPNSEIINKCWQQQLLALFNCRSINLAKELHYEGLINLLNWPPFDTRTQTHYAETRTMIHYATGQTPSRQKTKAGCRKSHTPRGTCGHLEACSEPSARPNSNVMACRQSKQ